MVLIIGIVRFIIMFYIVKSISDVKTCILLCIL